MPYQTTELDSFFIIGIEVRTTNENSQSQKDIGELWQRFYDEDVLENIPRRVSDDIYCVYTDYENGSAGAYSTIIGCKVESLDVIPEGYAGKIIPESMYQVYTSTGKIPECVINTWRHIWQTQIERRYSADFDVYGAKAQDMRNAEVETYISINSTSFQIK